ncbi:MAG: zinc-dependent alcohol dehydrogenase family protein [Desulfobacteraceae bacterium]|nr:zinc-dependent alcohol dehydrogenase family protein [Desulfobacteraceae bacterium]
MPRIVRFHKIGGPEVLQLEELALETPGPGEVRLKVEAFGLNRAEVLFRQGFYLERPKTPSRIGYEAAGVVDAVGPDVSGVKVGDRVGTIPGFSMRKYGVYGESAIVPANIVAPYPANLSPVEGAAIWMQYMTAYGALVELGRLAKGDFVLITAASSSVGLAAIQITKWLGATAIATTRGAAKQQALLQAGADHVIVTDTEDLPRRVKEITDGRGARLIFDPVAGPFIEKLAKAAAFGGIIFEYGSLALAPTPFPFAEALGKGLSVRGYTLFEISGHSEKLARGKQFVYDGLKVGALKPVIAKTFKLEEVIEAHRYMESNEQVGKIVVTV